MEGGGIHRLSFFGSCFTRKKKEKEKRRKNRMLLQASSLSQARSIIAMPREKLRRGGRSIRTAQPLDRDSSGISIAHIKNVNLFKYKYPLK